MRLPYVSSHSNVSDAKRLKLEGLQVVFYFLVLFESHALLSNLFMVFRDLT